MFVTRALAATAIAGMAFGLSAPIAFADSATAVAYGDCGHHWGGKDHKRGDNDDRGNGRGNDRGDNRGNDRGDNRGNDRGDNGGNDRGDNRGNDRGDNRGENRGEGRGMENNGAEANQFMQNSAYTTHGWDHHCRPSHGADTGLGGSITGMNATQTALGAGLLAVAVAGGGVYLRRRQGFKA